MKPRHAITLAMLVGMGIGGITVEGLHAQAKPPVYYVAEIETTNADGYMKEYAPKAISLIKSSGGRYLAEGGNTTVLEGAPPKSRVIIVQWDSLEKIQAWRNSPEYKEHRKIGDKYAKFRAFSVEGVSQ